ncbi:hypothetical protein BN2537_16007 [Streptomyces venezuelae]|nr:hypothetical protein BN2537_16007 [Streptomyces venezuelae]
MAGMDASAHGKQGRSGAKSPFITDVQRLSRTPDACAKSVRRSGISRLKPPGTVRRTGRSVCAPAVNTPGTRRSRAGVTSPARLRSFGRAGPTRSPRPTRGGR